MGASVLCIDDGSSDHSAQAAEEAGATVIRQSPNQGKGVALQRGFKELSQAGWSQVCTVDADGQMPPDAACELAHESLTIPDGLWIGTRRMPASAPFTSRLGRLFSNALCSILAGKRAHDSQSGLRIYPLQRVNMIPCHGRRYCYEVEVLVRGTWAGWTLNHHLVNVNYPADRVTHFHFLRDNMQHAWTFARLLLRKVTPWPHKKFDGTRWNLRAYMGTNATPLGLSIAAGVGTALAIAPIIGLQTILLFWICSSFRINFPFALVFSNLNFGPLTLFWAALAVSIGDGLENGHYAPIELFTELRQKLAVEGSSYWQVLSPLFDEWIFGSLALVPMVSIPVALLCYMCCRYILQIKKPSTGSPR